MPQSPIDLKRRAFTRGAATGISLMAAGSSLLLVPAFSARADDVKPPQKKSPVSNRQGDTYQENEVIEAAAAFFGTTTQAMAEAVHKIFSDQGQPNAYIKGEEAGGAIIVGLRYGTGEIVMKNGGQQKVYWQGPSAGWDFGGDAVKAFTLVYNLPNIDSIYQRFPGVEGSAYFIGGIGVNYQQRGDIILAPMRSGVGLRLGANIGYLKYSREREWIPF